MDPWLDVLGLEDDPSCFFSLGSEKKITSGDTKGVFTSYVTVSFGLAGII